VIGGLVNGTVDTLQGLVLGTRAFCSNDSYLESGI